jgi:hypothetical protein
MLTTPCGFVPFQQTLRIFREWENDLTQRSEQKKTST